MRGQKSLYNIQKKKKSAGTKDYIKHFFLIRI